MKKSNNNKWLIIFAAALVTVAGAYYWRQNGPKCSEICTINDDGMQDCALVCEPGVSPEVAAQAQEAAQAA